MLVSNLESLLSQEPQEELSAQDATRQYPAQVNRAVSYSALVERTLVLLAQPGHSAEETLAELHHLFHTNPVPRRPGHPRTGHGSSFAAPLPAGGAAS